MQEALHAFLLSREPVFTAKHLSTWMRDQFALEMKREQQILDEQRKIGKDVLGGGKPAPRRRAGAKNGSRRRAHDSASSAATNVLDGARARRPRASGRAVGRLRRSTKKAREKTTVQPGFAHGRGGDGAAARAVDADPGRLAHRQDLAAEAAGAAGETHVRSGPAPTELPAQPTVILEAARGGTRCRAWTPPGPRSLESDAATMSAMPAVPPPIVGAAVASSSSSVIVSEMSPPYGSAPLGAQLGHLGRAQSVDGLGGQPPPYAHGAGARRCGRTSPSASASPSRSSPAVLGARALLAHGPGKGTLVVMVNAARAADVFIDGRSRGSRIRARR